MLEKLRNNPRIVVVALIAAGVLAIAVAAGNNKSSDQQPSSPQTSEQSKDSGTDSGENTGPEGGEQAPADQEPSTAPTESEGNKPPTAVAGGTANVDVRSDAGNYKSTVKTGNNQTIIVRKMVSEYLASKSETLSDEQKLYVETNIVSQLPRNDKIFPGQEVNVSESVLTQTIEASKQLTQEQIKRWSAYL